MKTFFKQNFLLVGLVAFAGLAAEAEVLDRPSGFKIGERMTLRPYVSMSLTYDSNVNSSHENTEDDCLWTISPAGSLAYDAESWSLLLSAYYNYRQYFKEENRAHKHSSFGEDLRWNWANSTGAEKGWSLVMSHPLGPSQGR